MAEITDGKAPGKGGFRALVVDDEAALRRAVAAYLERDGFEVRTAGDGAEALALARAEPPDVVVLDVVMPGMDGIEVCRQLRTFSDAYVIMLTARSEELDTLVGLAAGADDYMTKPFSPRVLVARIRTLMRRPRSGQSSGESVTEEPPRRFGPLVIDPAPREVRLDGEAATATQAQYDANGIQLHLERFGQDPIVRLDADRMGEVLANLLGNALRHSHPGQTVTLRVGTHKGRAVIEVADSGDGFPPEDADRLFERFYRGDAARSRDKAGSGIGLTLARAVVSAHDGTLRAISLGPGLGAAFTVTLPIATHHLASAPTRVPGGDAEPTRRPRTEEAP